MNSPTYISDRDLAKRWGVSRDCIWRWTRSGKIPKPVKLSERCTRWAIEKIEEHERSLQAA
jgi:prophage regulatory protein